MSDRLIVIGASLGGLEAMKIVLRPLSRNYPHPIVAIQHRHRTSRGATLSAALERTLSLSVVDAEDKQELRAGWVLLAPADYHLLVERGRVALSIDAPVQFSRPSIDVSFESAASSYGDEAVGVLLTGSNADGARGCGAIAHRGGTVIVQDPDEAEAPAMPRAALIEVPEARVMTLRKIGDLLAGELRESGR